MLKALFNLPPVVFMAFNFLSFQGAWLAGVKMQQQGLLIMLIILMGHFLLSQHRGRDLLTLIFITIVGCFVDLSISYVGLFSFKEGELLPFWLVLLWANFSLTFHYSMSWLLRVPVLVQAILGGVFGCFSYYAAYKLGAVEYPFGEVFTIVWLAVIWFVSLPIYVLIVSQIKGKYNELSRQPLPVN
jgi:hypothetical protein